MDMNKYEQTYLRYSLSDVSNLNNISGSLLNNNNSNIIGNNSNSNNINNNGNSSPLNSFYQPQSNISSSSLSGIGSIGSIGSNGLISGSSPPNFRNVLSPSSTPSSSHGNISSGSLLNNMGGSGSANSHWGQSYLSPPSNNNSFSSSSPYNTNSVDPFSIQLSPSPSNQVVFNNQHQPTTVTKPSIKSTGFNLNSGGNNNGNNNITKSPLSNSGGNPSQSQSTSSVSLLTSHSGFGAPYGSGSATNSFKDFSIGVDALSPLSDERLPSRYGNDNDSSLKSKWYQSQQPFDYTIVSTTGSGYHSEHNSFRSHSPSPNLNGFAYGSAPSSSSFPDQVLGKIANSGVMSSPSQVSTSLGNNNNNNNNTNNNNNNSNNSSNGGNNTTGSSNSNGKSALDFQIHDNHQRQQLIQMQLQQLQLQQQQLQYQQQQFNLVKQAHGQHQHHQHHQQNTTSPSLSSINSPYFSSNKTMLNNTVTTYNPLDTSSLIQSSYDTIFDLNSPNSNPSSVLNSVNDEVINSFNSTPTLQPQSPRNISNFNNNNINNNNNNNNSQPTTPLIQPQSPRNSFPQSPSNSSNNLKKESFIVSFKDTPSRNLFVRNVNPIVEDDDLYSMFSSYGPVKHIYCNCKSRGFVIVSYYDIRHATQAFKNLQNNEVLKKKIKIHYCISKDYSDQGTLVVFNLDVSITNQVLTQLFGTYGQIKEVRETPNKTHHKFIEYYDIRHASDAIKHLNKIELCGKKLRIQHSRPGGFNKNLFPNEQTGGSNTPSDYTVDDSSTSISTNFLDDESSNNSNGKKGSRKSAPNTPSGSIDQSTSNSFNDMNDDEINEMMDQFKYLNGSGSDSNNGSRSQTPLSHDHMLLNNSPPGTGGNVGNGSKLLLGQSPSISQPLSPIASPSSSTSSTPTIPARFSKPIIPLLVGLQSLDHDLTSSPPLSPLSPLSKSIKSPRPNDKLINSPRNINKESPEDKIQYNFNLDDVKSGLDSRTSIMIKNIPNRLTQTILLSIVDEHFKGAYDFLYLPIDPHTKVNYGYAFINFINYKHIIPFYVEFNSRKWEKFYCSKVCEITYARIQGKIALIQHLRNTSLGSHNKKISPIVFVSDISGSGEKPLHLATFSVDVFM